MGRASSEGSVRRGERERQKAAAQKVALAQRTSVLSFLYRRGPTLIALFLLVWSLTVFKRFGFQSLFLGAYTGGASTKCDSFASHTPDNSILQGFSSLGSRLGRLVNAKEAPLSHRSRVLLSKISSGGWPSDLPSLTIFCAPKAYTDSPDDMQRRALLSWLNLKPSPKVVLLGNDATFATVAKEFPDRVSVDARLDYNFNGVPQFHSIVARAQSADTDLSMIINGDIILLNDLMPAVLKVSAAFENWVLTAARWDLGLEFPFSFESGELRRLAKSGKSQSTFEESIRQYTKTRGSLHTYGGVDFWLWNNSPVPLFEGHMPPFTFGRSKYDNWLTHEIVAAGLRQVVDASEGLTNIHVAHAYQHVGTLINGSSGAVEAGKNFWSSRKKGSWEMFNNIHLAETHGSYTNQKGTALHAPWRLAACYEPSVANLCLLKRDRPANCSCEYSSYVRNTQSDPRLEPRSGYFTCGMLSVDNRKDYSIIAIPGPKSAPGLPHTMEQLLPTQAQEVAGLKVVTLVAVTFGYAEMLMNFICRLRLLGLDRYLVVAALDEELYQFAFNQGLAVYYERPPSEKLVSLNNKDDCAFGSQCFRQFTKLKSRAVLRVLNAGYSVLWSDVDIVWYTDPLPHLLAYGPGTFPIQSNEPNGSIPGTGIRRINSGFYFARSDAQTIEAFNAIVQHAASTKLSEQPSFYDILCGVKGENLLPDKEECRWHNGLRTIFLDRVSYPNGAVHNFWEAPDVTEACELRGCLILHNNWISGKEAKKERLVVNKYWHYDVERRMCMHPWHSKLQPLLPPSNVAQAAADVTAPTRTTRDGKRREGAATARR
eukprot:TRINITY_DN2316_c0_g1_i1.p1 TRINITY_DN2316_c0_g1~~TRINITY_DN2316_c0_g1_i1.p1  ORF type:complete len:824 (+),score=81.43 TRINITY_DN2316_c0_g1_i1:407-2878(+)